MRTGASQAKAMARQSLLGHYGTASGALLLAGLMHLGFLAVYVFLDFLLGHSPMPRELRENGRMGLMVLYYVCCTVGFLVFATGEFCICHRICAGKAAYKRDLFFALTCHPLGFAGLWLVWLLAGLAGLVPGGGLWLLASTWSRYMGAKPALVLAAAGVLVSLVLEFLAGAWFLAALTAVMDQVDAGDSQPYPAGASGGQFYGAGPAYPVEASGGRPYGAGQAYPAGTSGGQPYGGMSDWMDQEGPAWRLGECLGQGWNLVAGAGWRLWGLLPGFLGLYALGVLSMGIGFLWVVPYLFCTMVWFFREGNRPYDF